MKALFLIGVIFALVFLQTVNGVEIEGTWTDYITGSGYGGVLHLCKNGDEYNGLASERYIVVGVMATDTQFIGKFYEAGDSVGTFELDFTDSDFSGIYFYDGNPREIYQWNATRLSTQVPDNKECAKLLPVPAYDPSGKYVRVVNTSVEQSYFCTNQHGRYEVSYRASESLPAYGTGTIQEGGRVFPGVLYTKNFDGSLPGRELWYVGFDGSLYHIWWAGLGRTYIRLINDPSFHIYDRFTLDPRTTENNCLQNEYLGEQPYDYYPIQYELLYYNYAYYLNIYWGLYENSSSQLSISLVASALVVLLAFF